MKTPKKPTSKSDNAKDESLNEEKSVNSNPKKKFEDDDEDLDFPLDDLDGDFSDLEDYDDDF